LTIIVLDLSTETIENYFAACGLNTVLDTPNKSNSETDVLEYHQVGNYEEFSCIYNSFHCYKENEDCEEAVVEQTAAKISKATRMIRLSVNE
jgi:hypothetical protein